MKINGLQKMTLLDFPGKVACTVFLTGCDFRCPFCHNSDLLDGSADVLMDENGLYKFLETRKGLLDGVAFTGGEPLLRKDMPEVISRIKELGFKVKLDTNGYHPDLLNKILSDGQVDYIAMDIKNSPEKYALTVGTEDMDFSKIQKSVDLLKNGNIDFEFRTTCVEEFHTEQDIEKIGQWIVGAKHYFLQLFTDRESVLYSGLHAPSKEKMLKFSEISRVFIPDTQLRGVDL